MEVGLQENCQHKKKKQKNIQGLSSEVAHIQKFPKRGVSSEKTLAEKKSLKFWCYMEENSLFVIVLS